MVVKFAIIAGILSAAVLIGILVCYFIVVSKASGRIYDDIAKVPHNSTGILLATSPITRTGLPNTHFQARIEAADQLLKTGKIDRLIASGGDYRTGEKYGCDEPAAIRDSLVKRGISADRIILDYEGQRTRKSIENAKRVYRLDSVTIISQKFHNERALYLADAYGLEAIAFNASPSPYLSSRLKNNLREFLARVKLFTDLFTNPTN